MEDCSGPLSLMGLCCCLSHRIFLSSQINFRISRSDPQERQLSHIILALTQALALVGISVSFTVKVGYVQHYLSSKHEVYYELGWFNLVHLVWASWLDVPCTKAIVLSVDTSAGSIHMNRFFEIEILFNLFDSNIVAHCCSTTKLTMLGIVIEPHLLTTAENLPFVSLNVAYP